MRLSRHQLIELFRYYRTAIINTAFGILAYSFCVWIGMNIFLAQIVSYILGITFNYFTYSRMVFRDSVASKWFYILSTAVNYLVGVATLAILSRFLKDPYLIGVITSLVVSVFNYFGLKYVVFRTRVA